MASRKGPRRTRSRQQAGPRYFIRLSLPEEEWDDAWELCRGIEQCGGHRTAEGFGFCSEEARAISLEILQDRFGKHYFETWDSLAAEKPASWCVEEPGATHHSAPGNWIWSRRPAPR